MERTHGSDQARQETTAHAGGAKKPYFQQITPGVSLGYRRNQGPGAWLVRVADGKAGNWTKGFASADDAEKANDETVMDTLRL